jgi:hypothetical protein
MVLAEVNAFLELTEKVGTWAEHARSTRKKRKEQEAVRLLHSAAVLAAAIWTLDSVYRSLLSQLLLLTPDWTHDRREELNRQILGFATQDQVLGQIRRSLLSLEDYLRETPVDDLTREAVDQLMARARELLNGLEGRSATPWYRLEDVTELMRRVASASTPDEVRQLAAETTNMLRGTLAEMDRDIVWTALDAYARLQARLLSAQNLPLPDWSVAPSQRL